MKEMEDLTGISRLELETYSRDGLIGRRQNGETVFDSGDAKNIGLIRELEQFKLTKREIGKFFLFLQTGKTGEAVKILQNLRERIMRTIHEEQKSLDILDCIIYETKNKSGGAL